LPDEKGVSHCERSAAIYRTQWNTFDMSHDYWVYIMTNANNTVLYTGVTNDLARRVHEHQAGAGSAFTSKYNVTKLVFYERFGQAYEAIAAEKKIKAGSRAKKVALIEAKNPGWRDLTGDHG